MTKETLEQKISKEMTIEEILSKFPGKAQKIAKALTDAGLHCVGCGAATWETLEAGMLGHGFAESEIDALTLFLNEIISQKVDASTITMTEKAVVKFKEILKEEKKEGWGLRLGERAAGCSGFEYTLDFSEKPKEDDETFESNGMQIHVSKRGMERLLGCEIDYKEGLNNAGFIISNDKAKNACGCGSSHNY